MRNKLTKAQKEKRVAAAALRWFKVMGNDCNKTRLASQCPKCKAEAAFRKACYGAM